MVGAVVVALAALMALVALYTGVVGAAEVAL
jgi:hypothetical protein